MDTLGADALQQHRGRLVVAALGSGQRRLGRHQLAAEGFGQDRLRQLVGALRGRGDALLNSVSQLEEGIDAAHNPLLFFQRWARLSPACFSLRIDAAAVATTDGGSDAVKT